MALSLGISLGSPSLKLLGILIPVVYLIAERGLRRRTWAEIGLSPRGLLAGLRQNWGWALLVAVGTQALAAVGSYLLVPEYFRHVTERLPFDLSAFNVGLFVALGFATLGEEIIYRGLFQGRISAWMPAGAAIALTSLVFAAMHYTPGAALIVAIDLAFVLVDSLIYGIIFQRSRSVWVSWIPHFAADIVGLVLITMLK
jgi:membrane protease YdiL (CAAX protease family)